MEHADVLSRSLDINMNAWTATQDQRISSDGSDERLRYQFMFHIGNSNQKRFWPTSNGKYVIDVICQDQHLISLEITKDRHFVFQVGVCEKEFVAEALTRLLKDLYTPEVVVTSNLVAKEEMIRVKYATEYPVMFSLFHENPNRQHRDNEHLGLIDWDVGYAMEAYIIPFAKALAPISKLSLNAQRMAFTPLPVQPHPQQTENGTEYHLTEKDLSLFLNSADWNLEFSGSMNPPLRFLLFIPSMQPLKIVTESIHAQHGDMMNQPLESNAFLIPQWGGVVIRNSDDLDAGYFESEKGIQDVMGLFMAQLRRLVGLEANTYPFIHLMDSHYTSRAFFDKRPEQDKRRIILIRDEPTLEGANAMEWDRLMRKRTVECLVESRRTLKSLSNLILKLENMVVLETIREQIEQALTHYHKSMTLLSQNELDESWNHAKKSFTISQSAFFDPSIVSLLYFPDEHKFAVYMPLFVPLLIPIIVFGLRIFGQYRRSLQEKKQQPKKSKTD